jgi:hypothetical protein
MWPVSTSEFGYVLRATAQNLAQHCGPLRRISLSAVGHSTGSGSALWATVQNFVKGYGPRCRIIDHSTESQEFNEKFATTFKRNSKANVYIYIMHYPRPTPSMLEILPSLEKN